MSSLWTPGGERPVGGHDPAPSAPAPPAPGGPPPGAGPELADPEFADTESAAEMEARMGELRDALASTPASVVVANHCFGLFELAAVHLSLQPPQLDQAQIAIDALGAVIEGLAGRLGDEEEHLREGLTQLRLAYVQMKSVMDSGGA